MSLKVYSRTVCPQCTPVKSYLKSHNIEFELINIDNDAAAFNYLKENAIQSAPHLEVINDKGEIIATSTGRQAALDIMTWNKEGLI